MGFLRNLFGRKTPPEHPPASPQTHAPEILDQQETPAGSKTMPVHTRRLEPPKAFRTPSRRIRFGATSDVGGRSNNEDAAITLLASAEVTGTPPAVGLFLVADGMGGHQNGEVASSLTARTVAQFVINQVILPQLEGQDPSSDQKTIPEALADAMAAANASVQQTVPGGGTTATCAVIRGDLAYIAHVGDSRAYLLSEGNLEVITRDHLLVRRLQELGQLTAQEADVHPQRNVLYRAIGQADSIEIDATTRRLPPASRLLLCSDGLWGVIGDERIAEILQELGDPQEACDQLIAAAKASNGPDNITAIVVQM